jgi:flavin reductase (DIM6/NTAB) family NADH-FMN oxidoreductase RutF
MSDDPIKDVLNRIPYGFYSLTSNYDGDTNAMVCNWFSQVSFTPRLVEIGLSRTAYTYQLIEKSDFFAVNVFNADDRDYLTRLTKGRAKQPDKMDRVNYELGPVSNCPILEGAAAFLECRIVDLINIGGDHDLLIGEVINAAVLKPGEVEDTLTLLDLGWSYAG